MKNKISVFEIKTTKEDYNKIYEKINEARLTQEFIDECLKVSEQLKKN